MAEALQAMGSVFGQLCQQRTLPLMQLHAYAACTDPEIRAATRAAFQELRDSVERLTGLLPPARVQGWLGTGMLMTATTAMNPQAADIPRPAVTGERERRGRSTVRALDGVSAEFTRHSFTAVMGQSGSGKSTLLHCAAGLERPTSGTVWLGGRILADCRRNG